MVNIQSEAIKFWENLVNLEGRSDELECLNIVAEFMLKKFSALGCNCSLMDTGGAPFFYGMYGEEKEDSRPILLTGHYDTVFKKGTFGANPFRIEGNYAYGPGVLDMKGGIAIAYAVILSLKESDYTGRPIMLGFFGDEETGHVDSNALDVFRKACNTAEYAFNLETGNLDGSACIGRKGNTDYALVVKGKSSHPGKAFRDGISAIVEMSHKVVEFQNIIEDDLSRIINVGTIEGGTVSNCIPEMCSCRIDTRYVTREDDRFIQESLQKITDTEYMAGTKSTLERLSSLPAFEPSEEVYDFLNEVNAVLEAKGIEKIAGKIVGSASDASYLQEMGIKTLCGMGVYGEGNHSVNEYALVDSLMKRCDLITNFVKSK